MRLSKTIPVFRQLGILTAIGVIAACSGNTPSASIPSKVNPALAPEAGTITVKDSNGVTRQAAASANAYVQPAEASPKASAFNPQLRSNRPITTQLNLGPVSAEKTQQLSQEQAQRGSGKALQIGFSREVVQAKSVGNTAQLLQWSPTVAGGNIAAINFQSGGAQGMRIGVVVQSLPPEATLRFYAAGSTQSTEVSGKTINETIARNINAGDTTEEGRTYWSPPLTGENGTLEIELPKGISPASAAIAIPRISHFFLNPLGKQALTEGADTTGTFSEKATGVGAAGSCNLDIVCNAPASTASNAVAKMVYTKSGGSYLCTGTLLADTLSSGTPYFLSAHHCISSQTVASTLTTYWFYKSSACNNGVLNPNFVTKTGGASYLWGRSATSGTNGAAPYGTDTSFMRLVDTPPAGAVFAGWSSTAQAPGTADYTGVHNPSGDLQKYSVSNIKYYAFYGLNTSTFTTDIWSLPNNSNSSFAMYQVQWNSGITEGGSSGSGLFLNGNTNNPRLIGQLYGGFSSCTDPTGNDVYGRFDIAYREGLNNWLSPSAKPIYRFYNTLTGTHFFTISEAERNNVLATLPQYIYENVAFYASTIENNQVKPVYRFFNTANRSHFYTISVSEKDYVLQNLPQYNFEGVSWYASPTVLANWTPLYRFFRPSTGSHFYTVSAAERDSIINNLGNVYVYEGLSYYVKSTP
jgi:lysyl endopeptidase